MGTPGALVVKANGKFAVLANGKFAVYNAAGECPECCGGASTSCTDWGTNCFDGDELADPPVNPTNLPVVLTYTPCDGAVDCAGKTGYSGVMWMTLPTMKYSGAGGGFDFYLRCTGASWDFAIFSGGVPSSGCYGNATPALVCANGKYPTGTFAVTMYDTAKGTSCGIMTVTFGP